jgi:hypothetical protein
VKSAALTGASRAESVRFTPLYRTAWRIDDLYVDPKKH